MNRQRYNWIPAVIGPSLKAMAGLAMTEEEELKVKDAADRFNPIVECTHLFKWVALSEFLYMRLANGGSSRHAAYAANSMGVIRMRRQAWTEAEWWFEQVLERIPNQPATLFNLAEISAVSGTEEGLQRAYDYLEQGKRGWADMAWDPNVEHVKLKFELFQAKYQERMRRLRETPDDEADGAIAGAL